MKGKCIAKVFVLLLVICFTILLLIIRIIGQSSDLANLLTDENHVHILSDKVLNNLVKVSEKIVEN